MDGLRLPVQGKQLRRDDLGPAREPTQRFAQLGRRIPPTPAGGDQLDVDHCGSPLGLRVAREQPVELPKMIGPIRSPS
jgi:hypothetical protein